MSNVTTEQRLRLIQQVRSRYHENQYDLSNRERILYGKSFTGETPGKTDQEVSDADARPPFSSFKLRLVVAILLGAAVISMDRNQTKIADFEENIEKMVAAMSQDTSAGTTSEQ